MATREQIQSHYDVDVDFFRCFLDERYMAYSCAVWRDGDSLENAQQRKLQRIARFAHVDRGTTVLDIGCGWGGMMAFLLNEQQATFVEGLTLSEDQYRHVRQLKMTGGRVRHASWEDYAPKKNFDAIVCVGALEHFASLSDRQSQKHVAVYRKFFRQCAAWSRGGAHLALQTIVTRCHPDTLQSYRDVHFLLKHVFPGSVLPTINDLQRAILDLYEIRELRNAGPDYVRTLSAWKRRLEETRDHVVDTYGDAVYRHYLRYFDSAIRSFQGGYADLVQMSLARIRSDRAEERFHG